MQIPNKEQFQSWLDRHQDAVFKPLDGYQCPIACWLQSLLPDETVFVLTTNSFISGNEVINPDWASDFILAFDRSYWNIDNPLTGKKAQQVLSQI